MSAFHTAVHAAKETQDFREVMQTFVNTRFYVVVSSSEETDQGQQVQFSVFQNDDTDNQPMVVVSEQMDWLKGAPGGGCIQAQGAELVQVLPDHIGIMIVIAENGEAFAFPKEQVQWLSKAVKDAPQQQQQ